MGSLAYNLKERTNNNERKRADGAERSRKGRA